MPGTSLLAIVDFTINGVDVSTELLNDVRSIEVDQHIHLPSMFTIEIHDDNLRYMDSDQFAIGTAIKVRARAQDQTADKVLIEGEVTAIEPNFDHNGVTTLLVRGYDKLHRLHRKRVTKTYLQMTDSDIASSVARRAGLTCAADSTSTVYEYVLQLNQSDFEFLKERAARAGCLLFASGTQIQFKKPASLTTTVSLKYAESLREFRPRVTAVSQYKTIEVRGWDIQQKQPVVSTSSTGTFTGSAIGLGGGHIAGTKSESGISSMGSFYELGVPVGTAAEGDSMAGSLASAIGSSGIQAEGVAFGNGDIRPGTKAQVRGLGTKFSGDYFLTRATHRWDVEDGYVTSFEASGFNEDTLADIVNHGAGSNGAGSEGRLSERGVLIGVVTNNKDDQGGMGRIKVKFPSLPKDSGHDIESHWVRIASPMAGNQRGFFFLPEINDEVLVAFEHGDPARGYVVGALWNGQDKPPLTAAEASDGNVKKRVLKTTSGHMLTFTDEPPSEQKIEIIDKTGKNKVIIDTQAKKITVEAENDVLVKAKNVTADASETAKVKGGREVTVESGNQVTVKGTTVNVEASANLNMKGSMVKLEGSGIVEIKGAMVKIN